MENNKISAFESEVYQEMYKKIKTSFAEKAKIT